MPVQLSPEQVGLEMLCLCGQLDLLIRAQMQQVHFDPEHLKATYLTPALSVLVSDSQGKFDSRLI